MRTIPAAQFKAKCLALLNDVAQSHDSILVTKHGKPVAKVVPVNIDRDINTKPLKDCITFMGDVISPIDELWEANQ